MSLRLPAETASITSGAIVVTVLAQWLSNTSAQTPTRTRSSVKIPYNSPQGLAGF